jgi:hypothetical protein
MLCRVALVRTDVSQEHIASIITVTRMDKLGATLAVTSNQSAQPRNINYKSHTASHPRKRHSSFLFSSLLHYLCTSQDFVPYTVGKSVFVVEDIAQSFKIMMKE